MFSLVYVSSATKPFTKQELVALLEKARANNTALGVTGMLLYKDGNFLQVLEGEEETVKNVYAKIANDPRHKGALPLIKGSEASRQFADWSMGFRDLNSPDTAALPGFSDFMNVSLTQAEFSLNPGKAKKLLLVFKQSM